MCLFYILFITMSLMITCAFTTSRHYACKRKRFCKLHELWNESLCRIIPCYVLCINSLLGLGRRQTCLWSPDLRGLYVSGAVWEVPCRSQGNMLFIKPHMTAIMFVTCHHLCYDIFGHHVTGLANKIVYWPQWWVEHVMGPTKYFFWLEWLRRCFIKFTVQWQMENDML